jgi:2'-hydroxyisoflavone reductase
MHILVLGGTQFLGRSIVETAVERGHHVTLFNRGQTSPQLVPELEKLQGDRDGDLGALAGLDFDAVIDTSGYVPRVVGETIDALGEVGHYTFVSTMSVYTEEARDQGEEGAVAPLPEETEEVRFDTYGPLKALCEDVVRERFPGAFIPRPGLIVGPWDHTGRFTYWPQRFVHGGRILAPAPREAPVQVVDVRDLATWIVKSAESGLAGTYNAVCPTVTMEHVLETCRTVARTDADVIWVDPAFLVEHEVGPWMELPLWIGADEGDATFMQAPVQRALDAGLAIRPLTETVRDTIDWVASGEAPIEPPAGLDREKEQAVLDAWLSKE